MAQFAVVVEKGGTKVRGGGSCFQLWFAVKSDVHVRYGLAGCPMCLGAEVSEAPVRKGIGPNPTAVTFQPHQVTDVCPNACKIQSR